MKATAFQNFGLAFCLWLTGCVGDPPVTTLRLGHSLDTAHPVHKAMEHMAEQLAAVSGGSMRLDLYPSGQLGNERELIELLQIGSLDMTKVSASPLEAFVPEMQVFNIPYVFRDAQHYQAVLDSDIGKQLLQTPARARLRGLGYYDAGARSFYTVEKPVAEPADLVGLKIRVQESATAMRMVSTLGGAPTPIAWGELYTALQQGVVDGAENNPPSFYLSGHYEVSRYYVLDEHTAVPDVLLIGTQSWSGLSPQQQNWLQQAVDASVVYQRALWREQTALALAAVEAAGVTVVRPDKQLFQRQVTDLHGEYQGTTVGDLITAIREVQNDAH
jgi:tripartite ATP-independent transporter DctP family solute receptor